MLYALDVDLDDRQRGIRARLELWLARHASEEPGYLAARVLAACLLHEPGLRVRADLCRGDEPALWLESGPESARLALRADVGRPAPERVRRAPSAAEQVAVVTHRGIDPDTRVVTHRGIDPHTWHRARAWSELFATGRVRVLELEPWLADELGARLEQRAKLSVEIDAERIAVRVGGESGAALEGDLCRHG
jgi:uncharacterized protein YaeQ